MVASTKFGSYSIKYGPVRQVKMLQGKVRGLEADKARRLRDGNERAVAKLEQQLQEFGQQLEALSEQVDIDYSVPQDCMKKIKPDPHKKAMQYWANNWERDKKRKRAGAFKCADPRTRCQGNERQRAHAIHLGVVELDE